MNINPKSLQNYNYPPPGIIIPTIMKSHKKSQNNRNLRDNNKKRIINNVKQIR